MADSAPKLDSLSASLALATRLSPYNAETPSGAPLSRFDRQAGPANDNRDESGVRHLAIAKPVLSAHPIQLRAKRLIDVLGAGAGLVLLMPVLLLIAALIRLESRGAPLFVQRRIGLDGKPFEIVKFRSMVSHLQNAAEARTGNAGRITRIGRFLRKTNLDELPQLWNVLRGDMSLVGPRPHVPDMMAAGKPYEELVSGYEYRTLMRPGMTGLAQARGLRGPIADRKRAMRRVLSDVEYIRQFSLILDMKIIARTLANEFKGGTGS